MPVVMYNGYHVSDQRVRDTLQLIADTLGRSLNIRSGDRDFVPTGGAANSLHLLHEAADFHAVGLDDEHTFQLLRMHRVEIFGPEHAPNFHWQIIRHGVHTVTGGPHIHLGFVPPGNVGNRPGFLVEGLTPAMHNHYILVEP